jgi:hypothetical protein
MGDGAGGTVGGERRQSVRTGVGAERRHDDGTLPKPAMFGSAFDGDVGGAVSEGRERA